MESSPIPIPEHTVIWGIEIRSPKCSQQVCDLHEVLLEGSAPAAVMRKTVMSKQRKSSEKRKEEGMVRGEQGKKEGALHTRMHTRTRADLESFNKRNKLE